MRGGIKNINLNANKAVFFPGLNGIRAIAALIVMIFHIDQYIHYFELESFGFWETRMQSYAVVLFFVLSGFLITYLLLTEKTTYSKINFRNFYIRRILRIWPVYYATLFISLLIIIFLPYLNVGPPNNILITFLSFGFLLPNFGFLYQYGHSFMGVLWSVGVEEQFYAIWPIFINASKKTFKNILIFFFVFLFVKFVIVRYKPFLLGVYTKDLFAIIPFDCLAVGAIAACLVISKSRFLNIVYTRGVQLLAWAFLITSIFYKPIQLPFFKVFNDDFHAVVYAIIILNVATNKGTIIGLRNKMFDFLGKISYGIYAYHLIVLFLLSTFIKPFLALMPLIAAKIIVFPIVVVMTVIVAYFSSKYFEMYFLKKKEKFMMIKSSNIN